MELLVTGEQMKALDHFTIQEMGGPVSGPYGTGRPCGIRNNEKRKISSGQDADLVRRRK